MKRIPGKQEQHSIVSEYTRLSGSYDCRWSFYIEATTRGTLRRLPLETEDQVLNVGCGTGALLNATASKSCTSSIHAGSSSTLISALTQ